MSEMKPIETAPKDRWFLAYRPDEAIGTWDRFVIVRWHDGIGDFVWPDEPFDIFTGDFYARDENDFYEAKGTFTRWADLPTPPEDPS